MLKIFIILGSSVCEIWADKSKLGDFWTPPISLKICQIAKTKKLLGIALRYDQNFFEWNPSSGCKTCSANRRHRHVIVSAHHRWAFSNILKKGLFPFNLRFPFVICSVSILVDTASSVLTPLKAGWNFAKSFMHEQLLPKHNMGLGYELEGWICLKLLELLFIYLHISAICFQNILNIIDQCCRNVFATYFYASFMKIFWLFLTILRA
jgi:hypothetical protein